MLKKPALRLFFCLLLGSELFFFLWWLAFFPAVMSTDSFDQWGQLDSGILHNIHPYVHTLWLGLLRLGTHSPALASFLQLSFTALLASGFSSWLIAHGVSTRLTIISHLWLVLAPATGIYNVTLWKDVTAAQFVLALIFFWVALGTRPPRWGRVGLIVMCAFAIVVFMAAITRHNHLPLFFCAPAAVWGLLRTDARLKLAFSACLALLYVVARIPLWNGSIREGPDPSHTFQLWILTYGLHNNSSTLSADDRAFLVSLVPDTTLVSTCQRWDYLISSPANNRINTQPEVRERIAEIFFQEVIRNPGIIVEQRTCGLLPLLGFQTNFWVYWDYLESSPLAREQTGTRYIQPDSKSPLLLGIMQGVLQWSATMPQRYVFWNHAAGLLLLLLIGGTAIQRRDRVLGGIGLMLIPLVLYLFVIFVAIDWRYLYFLYLSQFYSIPLLLLSTKKHRLNENEKASASSHTEDGLGVRWRVPDL